MIIENKELYNLFKSVKTGYKDYEMSLNGYGLYVEGFIGGITVYAYNGAAYRKTIYGDNKEAFVSYWSGWQKKDGLNYAENLQFGEKIDNGLFTRIKASFEAERFNCFTVKAREFFKAVYAVDNVNKGEKRHEIIISAYDGNLDIASWNNGDFGRWQLDAPVQASGAVMVNRKFLDNIRNAGTLEFSCLEYNGKTGLYIKGGIEAVLPTLKIDPAEFLEVLEYEYKAPEKPVAEPAGISDKLPELAITEKPAKQADLKQPEKPTTIKQARKPVKRAPKLKASKKKTAFFGYFSNSYLLSESRRLLKG
jgi:hypothetical protein